MQLDGVLQRYSELASRDSWFSPLHLVVNGQKTPILSPLELALNDSELRAGDVPFDGFADVAGWLGLPSPGTKGDLSSLAVHVSPPVELGLNECALSNGRLSLRLYAHPSFDLKKVKLSARGFPGVGLVSRVQIAEQIDWKRLERGVIQGEVVVDLPDSDQVIVMLMLGTTTVRRNWFVDPDRARNQRLFAMRHFDEGLKMISRVVGEGKDAANFEKSVASLMFSMGFNPSLQVETQAPDILATTPAGRLVLVECTLRLSDVYAKVGKLVDRRNSLKAELESNHHRSDIVAVLVCGVPSEQIAAAAKEAARSDRVVLIAKEQLERAIDSRGASEDPDKMLEKALNELHTQQ